MIRRPPRSTLFPYTTALPICARREPAVSAFREGESDRDSTTRGRAGAGASRRASDRCRRGHGVAARRALLHGRSERRDRKSTRLNSSHLVISYAVFFLKKKTT